MARAAILVVLLLGVSYSHGMIAGMNPMLMAGMMKGGQSDMMKMMALMSMMKSNQETTNSNSNTGTTGAASTGLNPMMSGMMRMGLCKSTETNESPFCTPGLCQLKGQMRFANPNMYECVLGFGCCYKDHSSMMVSKILN